MNILITGGAGFKGCVTAQLLLDAGHKVTVIDNLRWGAWPIMGLMPYSDFTFINEDVRALNLKKELSEYDVVINLAAVVGHPACDASPVEAKETNEYFVQKLCRELSKQQYLVHASTGSVYGKLEETCTEDSLCNPLSLYGETKLNAEKFVEDIGGVSLRFATAFGVSPCMRFDVVPGFFSWKALVDGFIVVYQSQARRTLIDVKDMARSYDFSIENYGDMQGHVYNVGDEKLNVTKRYILDEVAKKVGEIKGKEIKLFDETTMQDKDARDYEVSYEKIAKLGFRCEVSLDQGLDETIKAAQAVIGTNANPWRIN